MDRRGMMTDQKHRLLEDQLQGLKKDYMKHQMSDTQLEQLRQKIKEAKTMDKTVNNTRTKSRLFDLISIIRIGTMFSVIVLILYALGRRIDITV